MDQHRVEDVLRSFTGVTGAVVLGVSDAVWGERVVAVVTEAGQGVLSPDDLLSASAALLAPAERPRDVHILDEFPISANGKIDRNALKSLFSPA